MNAVSTKLVASLLDPRAYPEPTSRVELRETHISWVFLTDGFVYKVKKPVRYAFLDFSTAERRRAACEREMQLNRRLAPDVYLRVAAIGAAPGEPPLRVDVPGPPGEPCVVMKRLPQERMWDTLLAQPGVTHEEHESQVDRLLDVLCPFYERAERIEAGARFGHPDTIRQNARENFDTLRNILAPASVREARGETPSQPALWIARCEAAQLRMLALQRDRFLARQAEGWVRDGHGDLRAEHVCFVEPPAVFDCVEFSDALRSNDVLDELCFLAMDLEFRGRARLACLLVERYRERMRDPAPDALAEFYRAYRACVRAKVDLLSAGPLTLPSPPEGDSDDGGGAKREGARPARPEPTKLRLFEQGLRHLELAAFHTILWPPLLVVTVGTMGSGKSTLAAALAGELGLVMLRTDEVRRRLLPDTAPRSTPAPAPAFNEGRYTPEARDAVYRELVQQARAWLTHGASVVLDGTFLGRSHREAAADAAREAGATLLFVEADCPREVALQRIAERRKRGDDLSEARPDLYDAQARTAEPPAAGERSCWVRIDATRAPAEQVAAVIAALSGRVAG